MHKYRMMVYHVADTPATIRQCDIYRLTTLAQERGCLRGFCRWLLRQRPDLTEEVVECRKEITENPQHR